jgi:hypothetical protein
VVKADILGWAEFAFPSTGPFPLSDSFGMAWAVLQVLRTTDPGHNDPFVQFGTAREMRTCMSNRWHASPNPTNDAVMVGGQIKMSVSTSLANSKWYERFMKGNHKRIRENSKPDLAISVEVLVELMSRFELGWEATVGIRERQGQVLFPSLFSVLSFAGGLRGDETPKIDLAGVRKYYPEATAHAIHPHVVIAILGRIKGEPGEIYHLMPMALRWLRRAIDWYESGRISDGPMFRRKVHDEVFRARASEYEIAILGLLDEIQRDPELRKRLRGLWPRSLV